MSNSKRFRSLTKIVEPRKDHTIDEAVARVKETATAKFVESVEIAVRLGVDPKKADQAVRGTVALPHGTGKQVRVLVLARPPRDEEARAAGADHAGLADYIQQIPGGWIEDVRPALPYVRGTEDPRALSDRQEIARFQDDHVVEILRELRKGSLIGPLVRENSLNPLLGRRFESDIGID